MKISYRKSMVCGLIEKVRQNFSQGASHFGSALPQHNSKCAETATLLFSGSRADVHSTVYSTISLPRMTSSSFVLIMFLIEAARKELVYQAP